MNGASASKPPEPKELQVGEQAQTLPTLGWRSRDCLSWECRCFGTAERAHVDELVMVVLVVVVLLFLRDGVDWNRRRSKKHDRGNAD